MTGADTVRRYFETLVAHDFDGFAACLGNDVVRVGPYGDRYEGRDAYVGFLADLMPTLAGYHLEVVRVVASGSVVLAEIAETVEVDGAPLRTPEALVFDLDASGLIGRVSVYTQRGTRPKA